jgi:hypothetical protein
MQCQLRRWCATSRSPSAPPARAAAASSTEPSWARSSRAGTPGRAPAWRPHRSRTRSRRRRPGARRGPTRRGSTRSSASTPRGLVVRPAGVRLDSGGLGKGLAADVAALTVPAGIRLAISCGGDLTLRGSVGSPWDIAVESARSGRVVHRLRVRSGGVATSGVSSRLWRRADGAYAHHLIDPSTGEPAWTGLVAATAVAASALDAEILAKAALLSGATAARRLLARRGGVLQHDDGRVEVVAGPPAVRLPRRALETAA